MSQEENTISDNEAKPSLGGIRALMEDAQSLVKEARAELFELRRVRQDFEQYGLKHRVIPLDGELLVEMKINKPEEVDQK